MHIGRIVSLDVSSARLLSLGIHSYHQSRACGLIMSVFIKAVRWNAHESCYFIQTHCQRHSYRLRKGDGIATFRDKVVDILDSDHLI